MSVNETTEAKYTTNPPRISGGGVDCSEIQGFFSPYAGSSHGFVIAMLFVRDSGEGISCSTGKYNQVAFYSAAAAVKFGNRRWWRWQ